MQITTIGLDIAKNVLSAHQYNLCVGRATFRPEAHPRGRGRIATAHPALSGKNRENQATVDAADEGQAVMRNYIRRLGYDPDGKPRSV